MTLFGQIIIGAPGSGKTTYCFYMKEYYEYFGRQTCLINLDPANDLINKFDIDIRDLISLDEVEKELSLGPNSSFLYCFNFLEKNFNWLQEKINHFASIGKKYIMIDTPGQIEIFTQSSAFKNIIHKLSHQNEMNIRLCVVNLIESNNLCDLSRYIFSIFSVLNAMINLEQPQINVITKIDLLKYFDDSLTFPLNFYKNPNDSQMLNEILDQANMNPKFKKLNKLLSEFVIDYGLVSFDTLDVKNQKHLNKIASLIDKANGYIYLDTGSLKDEKYIEIRNQIAKNDLEFQDEDEEDYMNENAEGNAEGISN